MSEEIGKLKLTGKQKAFADAYLTEAKFNASEAARIAGYSKKTAGQMAFENLRKPEILAYMRELQSAQGINEFQTLKELKDVGYSEWKYHIQVIYDSEGKEKDCILQLKDKVKALEILAKIQKMLDDKTNVNLEVNSTKVYAGFDLEKV